LKFKFSTHGILSDYLFTNNPNDRDTVVYNPNRQPGSTDSIPVAKRCVYLSEESENTFSGKIQDGQILTIKDLTDKSLVLTNNNPMRRIPYSRN
jgi:hypothetical protein